MKQNIRQRLSNFHETENTESIKAAAGDAGNDADNPNNSGRFSSGHTFPAPRDRIAINTTKLHKPAVSRDERIENKNGDEGMKNRVGVRAKIMEDEKTVDNKI